jgi:hypothetical protein
MSVPFVDYARGDGLTVGPGQTTEWSPVLIGDEDGWVDRFQGLWGLDTGDRFAGERAPAGPKYTRTGSVRQSWFDPLGFAGLGKVAPPSQAIDVLERRIAELAAARKAVTTEAEALSVSLPKLDAEVGAIRNTPGLEAYREARLTALREGALRLTSLRTQEVELGTAIAAGYRRLADLRAGRLDDPRLHLHHASEPEPPAVAQRRAFAETWAAISVGVLVVALALIVWFRILPAPAAVIVLLSAYLIIESFFHRGIGELLLKVTVALAIISALILAGQYVRELVLAGLFGLGVLLIVDNLGELRRRLS